MDVEKDSDLKAKGKSKKSKFVLKDTQGQKIKAKDNIRVNCISLKAAN